MFLSARIAGLLFITAGIFSAYVLLTLSPAMEDVLDRLPDYDHTVAARRLMVEKKYGEARVLCQDIIDNDLPGKKAAEIIAGMCDEKLRSVKERLWRTAEAFVTGNPGESIEQAGAAVVSDMLMYGDIRDLVMQGYYKVTGKETDPWVAFFSAAGLATELLDAVDWLPSFLKALRRAGAVSDKMAKSVIDIFRSCTGRSRRIRHFCCDMTDFYRSGFFRTKTVFKNLEHADGIAAAARMFRRSPSAAHLISKAAGKNTAAVFGRLSAEKFSPSLLRKLLCKGPDGVTVFLRLSKSAGKGNVERAVYESFRSLKKVSGHYIWLLPPLLTGVGLLLNLKPVLRSIAYFRKKSGTPEEIDGREREDNCEF